MHGSSGLYVTARRRSTPYSGPCTAHLHTAPVELPRLRVPQQRLLPPPLPHNLAPVAGARLLLLVVVVGPVLLALVLSLLPSTLQHIEYVMSLQGLCKGATGGGAELTQPNQRFSQLIALGLRVDQRIAMW